MTSLEEIESKLSRIKILNIEHEQTEKDINLMEKWGIKANLNRRGLE